MTQPAHFFENAFATIDWDSSCQAAFIIWHKYASSSDYQQIMNKVLEVLNQNKGRQILADSTNRGVIDLVDQQWTVKDWYPRAAAIGYNRIAMVNPTNVVTKMSIDRVMKQLANSDLEEGYFATLDEARAWLKQDSKAAELSPALKIPEQASVTSEVFYENDYIVIGWVDSGRYAYGRWKKYADSADFRFGLNKVAEFLSIKQTVGYLADLRLAGIISLEDQRWLAEEWRTKLPSSLQRVAQLTPKSATVSLAAKRLVRRSNNERFEQVFFDDEKEAIAWLREVTLQKATQ